MEKKKQTQEFGIGFAEALTLLFIALRLTDHIDWSWIWVLAPIWITVLLYGVCAVIIFAINKIQEKNFWK